MPSHEESTLPQNEGDSDFLAIINYYIQDVSIYNCIKHGSISGKISMLVLVTFINRITSLNIVYSKIDIELMCLHKINIDQN